MPTRHRSLRLLAPAVVALLALGGAACSDDDGGDDAASTTSTEAPTTGDQASTTEDEGTTTETEDDGTTTEPEDDGSTTTAPDGGGGGGSLADRIPDIEGYQRELGDDGDDSITDEHCDGSTPSVQPVEEASADYESGDGSSAELLAIAAVRFSSEAEASTAYEEFVDTTSGCSQDSLSVDEGTSVDIGDEGMSWELTVAGQGGGALYLARRGDELWFLSLLAQDAAVDDVALAAFTSAVEG